MPTFSCSRRTQLGFTLVELLTVIGIIAVLAGMAFGVVSVVRKQAKLVQCTNNLQNLGTGMKAFQMDSGNNAFPDHLGDLFSKGRPLEGASWEKTAMCPFDGAKGTDREWMGRPPISRSNWGDLRYLYDVPDSTISTVGSSYLYEISSFPLDPAALSYFFPIIAGTWSPAAPPNPTWMQGKLNFLLNHPDKYRRSDFPIIRDFHHFDWTGQMVESRVKKVYNLSWDLGVFWSIPQWENGYQP